MRDKQKQTPRDVCGEANLIILSFQLSMPALKTRSLFLTSTAAVDSLGNFKWLNPKFFWRKMPKKGLKTLKVR